MACETQSGAGETPAGVLQARNLNIFATPLSASSSADGNSGRGLPDGWTDWSTPAGSASWNSSNRTPQLQQTIPLDTPAPSMGRTIGQPVQHGGFTRPQPPLSGTRPARALAYHSEVRSRGNGQENILPNSQYSELIAQERRGKGTKRGAKRDYKVAPSPVMKILTNTFLKVVITSDPDTCVQHEHLLAFFDFFRRAAKRMGTVSVTGKSPVMAAQAVKNKHAYLKDVKSILHDDAYAMAQEYFERTIQKDDEETQLAYNERVKDYVKKFIQRFGNFDPKQNIHRHLAWNIPLDRHTLKFAMAFTSFEEAGDGLVPPTDLVEVKNSFPSLFQSSDSPQQHSICLRGMLDDDDDACSKNPAAFRFCSRTEFNGKSFVSIYIKPFYSKNCSGTVSGMKNERTVNVKLNYPDETCTVFWDSGRNDGQSL